MIANTTTGTTDGFHGQIMSSFEGSEKVILMLLNIVIDFRLCCCTSGTCDSPYDFFY